MAQEYPGQYRYQEPPWWWLVGLLTLALFGLAAYMYITGDALTRGFGGFFVFFGLITGVTSLLLRRDARRKKRAAQGHGQ